MTRIVAPPASFPIGHPHAVERAPTASASPMSIAAERPACRKRAWSHIRRARIDRRRPERGGTAMRHWIWIPRATDPEALQASVNAFLARLQTRGGTVVSINYSVLGQNGAGPEPLFSLCLTYQSDLSPAALLSADVDDAPAARIQDPKPPDELASPPASS